MKKFKGPQIIVANRLTDGRAVFLTESGDWSALPAAAAVAKDAEALEALIQQASASEQANLTVSAEPVPASQDEQTRPSHIKQQIQATGPTVRPDLGYQAESSAQSTDQSTDQSNGPNQYRQSGS